MADYQKPRSFDSYWKSNGNILKELKFLHTFIALKIWFTMGKLWYYVKYYGPIPKTMELWLTMKNYGTKEIKYDSIVNCFCYGSCITGNPRHYRNT